MSRIAIVQRPPIFLNRAETTRAAAASILEAAQAGAQLIVFTTSSGSCMQTSTSTASVPRSASLDTVGHYSRPDFFQLHVNTGPLRPVEFDTLPRKPSAT